jgi:hypothetical protein
MYDQSVPQPRRGGYQRVSQQDTAADDGGADKKDMSRQAKRARRMAREEQRAATMEAIQNKIWAVLWTGAMVAVLYYTDFFRVCLTSDRVNRVWFNLSLLCWGVDGACMCYLGIYLPWKGIDLEWNVYCPRVIPVASAAMVLGGLFMLFGLWPVWGFITPFILGINGIGFLMSLHFVPACNCCGGGRQH